MFETLLRAVTEKWSLPPCEAELTFCDEEEIRTLNREHRGVDAVTDVLSFPALEADEGNLVYNEIDKDPETGKLILGDVVLCRPVAEAQAAEYGHSVEREIAYLELHSLLHLVGFDHETEEQKARMRAAEEEILGALGLTR